MGCNESVTTVKYVNPPPPSSSSRRVAVITPTTPSSSTIPIGPSNSNTNTIQKQDRGHRAQAQEIVQNFLLIWLDEKIDESSDDFRNSIRQLRQTVNTIEIFHDTDECIGYMSQLQNEKSFLIISGTLCESVVPRIHDMTQLYSIYIFCRKKAKYEEWAKNWSKIKDIFVEIDSICESVRQTARQCDEDSIVISGLPSLNQTEPTFMYTQLFTEIILEIDFDEKKEIIDLAEYARENHRGNEQELKIIDEFARDYQGDLDENNKPVWWYTRECFSYRMLNKALGKLQVETLLKMGIFIRHLHQNIKKLHAEQLSSAATIQTLYRGKGMKKKEFEDKIKQGGLMSFNNFLSTSNDREVAMKFISDGLKSAADEDAMGVLFEMKVDRSTSSALFASIDKASYFPTENEILFSTHTVFRIQYIEEITTDIGIKITQVKLRLITEDEEQQLTVLTKQIREEITGTGWERMGLLLWKLGDNDKAEQVYTILLDQACNQSDKAHCCNQLGLIKSDQGDYNNAVEFFQKTHDIYGQTLPLNHPDLATLYSNIGLVYTNMGEYSKALSSCERSLEIRKIALPPSHPDLANSYNNTGLVYNNMGEYWKALSSYRRSLEIRKIALPPNHPDLATSHDHIGSVYDDKGEYVKALSSCERSLEIRKIALPPNHPDLATSYNNIGSVSDNMGEYEKALSYYGRAQEIWQQSLPPEHPHIATVKSNIEMVRKKL